MTRESDFTCIENFGTSRSFSEESPEATALPRYNSSALLNFSSIALFWRGD